MVSSSKTRPFPPSCGRWGWPGCTCAGLCSARVVRRRARASAVHGRRPGAAPGYAPRGPIFAKSKCDFSSFALSGERARNSFHKNNSRRLQAQRAHQGEAGQRALLARSCSLHPQTNFKQFAPLIVYSRADVASEMRRLSASNSPYMTCRPAPIEKRGSIELQKLPRTARRWP